MDLITVVWKKLTIEYFYVKILHVKILGQLTKIF